MAVHLGQAVIIITQTHTVPAKGSRVGSLPPESWPLESSSDPQRYPCSRRSLLWRAIARIINSTPAREIARSRSHISRHFQNGVRLALIVCSRARWSPTDVVNFSLGVTEYHHLGGILQSSLPGGGLASWPPRKSARQVANSVTMVTSIMADTMTLWAGADRNSVHISREQFTPSCELIHNASGGPVWTTSYGRVNEQGNKTKLVAPLARQGWAGDEVPLAEEWKHRTIVTIMKRG